MLDLCMCAGSTHVFWWESVSGRVLFLGCTRRRKGEGVVYSLFSGYLVHPNPAKSRSSITRKSRKITTVLPTVTSEPGLILRESQSDLMIQPLKRPG